MSMNSLCSFDFGSMQLKKGKLESDSEFSGLNFSQKLDWKGYSSSDFIAKGDENIKKLAESQKYVHSENSNDFNLEDNYYEDLINENFGGKHLPKIKEESETGGLDSAWNSERSIKMNFPVQYQSEYSLRRNVVIDRDEPDVIRTHTFVMDTTTIPKASTGESATNQIKPESNTHIRELDKVAKEVQTEPLEIVKPSTPVQDFKTTPKLSPKKDSSKKSSKILFSHLESTLKLADSALSKRLSAHNVKSPRLMTNNILATSGSKITSKVNKRTNSPKPSVDAQSNVAKRSDSNVHRMKSLETMPHTAVNREVECPQKVRPDLTNLTSSNLGKSQGDHTSKPNKPKREFKSTDKIKRDNSKDRFPFNISKTPASIKVQKQKTGMLREMMGSAGDQKNKFIGQGLQSVSFGTQDELDDSMMPNSVDQQRVTPKPHKKALRNVTGGQTLQKKVIAADLRYY